jgi:hypothetical protein
MDASVIENEALKLSAPQRALLADRLMQTLGLPAARVMQAWAKEGERRLAEVRTGKLASEDGEALLESLRKRLA